MASSAALTYQSLAVRRMPGFPDGGFAVEELSPGINIVFGPNACGKTTFALALQYLLWPAAVRERGISLAGRWELGGANYLLDLAFERLSCQRNGAEAERPVLPPLEVRDRYWLALHELLQEDDRQRNSPAGSEQFAREILRESAGGYDLAEAIESLNLSVRARGGMTKAARQLREAESAVRMAESEQVQLRERERRLRHLEQEAQAAREARRDVLLLDRGIVACQRRESLAAATARLRQFAEPVSRLRGDELERLERSRRDAHGSQQELDELQRGLSTVRQILADAPTSLTQLTPEIINGWRGAVARYAQLRETVAPLEREVVRAERQLAEAARALGEQADPERLAQLDNTRLRQVLESVEQAAQWRDQQLGVRRILQWLQEYRAADSVDLEQLARGRELLANYLRHVEPAAEVREQRLMMWILVAGTGLVGTGLLVVLGHPWAGLSLAASAAAATGGVLWYVGQRQRLRDQRLLAELSATGLWDPPTEHWDLATDFGPARLGAELNRLDALWSKTQAARQITARWDALREEYDRWSQQVAHWEQRYGASCDALGLTSETSAEQPLAVQHWVGTLLQWQKAQGELLGRRAELAHAQEQCAQFETEIRRQLAAYCAADTLSADQWGGAIDALDQQARRLNEARQEQTRLEEQLARESERLAKAQADEQQVFDSLRITPDEEDQLREWAAQREVYFEAAAQQKAAQAEYEHAAAQLAHRPELLELSLEELMQSKAQAEQIEATTTDIVSEMASIQEAVRATKAGYNLEHALTARDDARAALATERDEDYDRAVGWTIAHWLAEDQQRQHQPAVMREASDLFAKITHGRYELQIQGGTNPTLRPTDQSTGVGHALNELSSGTRLQLLLAVRMAFVQRLEAGVQLPLILDETLGNSDERRAAQIIEAAIEIARGGRQVFYFTAQVDEVAKWQRALDRCQPALPHRVVDLAAIRGFSEQERMPRIEDIEPAATPEIPAPEEMSRQEYASALGVPGFDPYRDIGGTHLWYLVPEPEELYQLLLLGINHWGQLTTLVRHGQLPGYTADAPLYRQAAAAAAVLRSFAKHWKIGRGLPVDRLVLEESKAVSERFIDEVSALAEQCGGNARALLEGLRNKQVSGFQRNSISKLESYLSDSGHLDESEPLVAEDLLARVRVDVSQYLQDETLSLSQVDWLLSVAQPRDMA